MAWTYLVIGKLATQAYGAERPTGDSIVWSVAQGENFDRLAAAMRSEGTPPGRGPH